MTKPSLNTQPDSICAKIILEAFHAYQNKFTRITKRAKERFEKQDRHAMRADATERLDIYKIVVDQTVIEIDRLLQNRINDKVIWINIKAAYANLCQKVGAWELAETFFNSITRQIFATVGVDPRIEFVDTCSRTRSPQIGQMPYRTYDKFHSTANLIETILTGCDYQTVFEDLQRDASLAAQTIENYFNVGRSSTRIERAEILTSVFYRSKGAYLVGRIFVGSDVSPMVLALFNNPGGIVVDAVLLDENDVSILFSFTRSYFHVDAANPYDLVSFLKSIIPRKRIAELWISIGYNKHGKSELYCDLLQHLSRSSEKFEIAKGEKGMVMEVFTMSDYDLVFKIIKDRFAYPKNTTREAVMAKYSLVFKHDRVGRLVDAQEFEHLEFERSRFSDSLLNSLQRNANHNLIIDDDHIVIRHAYLERRVTPLDIYLGEVDLSQAQEAVKDFGNAIKDLATSNIFPGDLLLKNFGVTRHGRVVFYDYDELCLLSACNFRKMPHARSYEDEISAEPWFVIGENDVFPEEFQNFLGLQGALQEVFTAYHGDLFEVHFWHRIQSRINAGATIDIFPYRQSQRLNHG